MERTPPPGHEAPRPVPAPEGDRLTDSVLAPRLLAPGEGVVSARRLQLHRMAAAARVLIDGLVGTAEHEVAISAAADDLERLAARFGNETARSMYDGVAESAMAGAMPGGFFDHSPMIGLANPIAPPITLEVHDDQVLGTVTFGSAYEGPPGCVHGGYLAAAFDEVLGAAQTRSGRLGMTGTLTVRYRKPTPLHTELRILGHYERSERRKVFTVGEIYHVDVLTAEAEGIFISIEPERFRYLREARDDRFAASPRESRNQASP